MKLSELIRTVYDHDRTARDYARSLLIGVAERVEQENERLDKKWKQCHEENGELLRERGRLKQDLERHRERNRELWEVRQLRDASAGEGHPGLTLKLNPLGVSCYSLAEAHNRLVDAVREQGRQLEGAVHRSFPPPATPGPDKCRCLGRQETYHKIHCCVCGGEVG